MKILSYLIVFLVLFILDSNSASAAHPIYRRLLELQPSLDKKLAMSISDEIYKCHKRIGVDKFIMTAIYNQESSINYKAKNCLKGILHKSALDEIMSIINKNAVTLDEQKLRDDLTHIPFKVCFDLGIGQINVNTALRYKQCTDLKRLITDYKYNISCSCKVLEGFKKRFGHKDKLWWTRYNANNPVKREIYRQLVIRYYPKKKEGIPHGNDTQPEKEVR